MLHVNLCLFLRIEKFYFFPLEKNLPSVKQPASVPLQISAITKSQANLDKPSPVVKASTPGNSIDSSSKKHTSQSSSNVNFNESPVKVEHSFNHQQQRSQQKSAKYTSNKAIKRRQQLESANYNENQHQNESEYNQFNSVSPSSQFQPQLVPIQTFTFFKWKINVDTLVRMFIIA